LPLIIIGPRPDGLGCFTAEHIAAAAIAVPGAQADPFAQSRGLLFICLADEPPAISTTCSKSSSLPSHRHRLDRCKIAHRIDLVEDGNWKSVMENIRECYHLQRTSRAAGGRLQFFGHAESDVKPTAAGYYERYKRMQAEFVATGTARSAVRVEMLDDRRRPFRVERMVLDNRGESYHRWTPTVASKRLVENLPFLAWVRSRFTLTES